MIDWLLAHFFDTRAHRARSRMPRRPKITWFNSVGKALSGSCEVALRANFERGVPASDGDCGREKLPGVPGPDCCNAVVASVSEQALTDQTASAYAPH